MQRVIAATLDGIMSAVNEINNADTVDCRRLFHGRGQCYDNLGHINVDWYHPVIFITLYQQVESEDWDQLLSGVDTLNDGHLCLLVQRRYLPGAPMTQLWGRLPETVLACEQSMQFYLSLTAKQNIGFFLDMSPGRQWLLQSANGKRVLNLFAYTCSLSVAAITGGACRVVNVDMSRAALDVGRKNHQLNGHSAALQRDIQFMPYDIFRSWKNIIKKGPYDIVVIDPPSWQKGSFIAEKDYARVVRRLSVLMPEGGDLLLCLNAPQLGERFLTDMMQVECPQAQKVTRLPNRADFPEIDSQRNVKIIHYSVPAVNIVCTQ